ncbi:hypothetical protein [Pelagibacterium luteolum]|uniref:Uncharacterized protein n=1 Tax=Pelagibacterium luteolum TaxID=440168 RepID=A0A1G7XWB7_9HYPH|nr:hypothetical protein [Pelagibacterium luteolum]SDG88306.1 hypothetical protein SAMN04487974_11132 [Pelagibacterium luteolum]
MTALTAAKKRILPSLERARQLHHEVFTRGPGPSVALVALSLVLAGCVALAYYELAAGAEAYEQFLVGGITFTDGAKARDFNVVFVFMAATVVCLLLAAAMSSYVHRRLGDARPLDNIVLLSLLPAALAFGPLLTGGATAIHMLVIGAVMGLLGVVFAALAAWRAPDWIGPSDPSALWSAVAASAVVPGLAFAVPFAINVATGKLGNMPTGNATLEAGLAFAAVTCAIVAILWVRAGRSVVGRLQGVLLALQVPLPLFFLIFIPPRLVSPEGPAPQPQAGPVLYILVGCLIIIAMADLARRALQSRSALSPWALGGLLICLAIPASFLPYLPIDDYHFGEYIYPWWALTTFGQLPYVDYTPAHGLVNYLAGAISDLLFDGSVAAQHASSTIAISLLALLLFVFLTPTIGLGLAWVPVFFVPLLAPISWLWIAVFVAAMTVPSLLDRKVLWLVLWVGLGTLTVLAAPAQGAAAVLASIPAGILMFVLALRDNFRTTVMALCGILAVLLLLALTTPMIPIIVGALTYVLENSGINAIAYGIPWTATATGSAYEILRAGWVAVPLLGIFITIARPSLVREPFALLALGGAIVFPLTISGYTMGRIDPGITRMGFVTLWLALIALPLMLVIFSRQRLLMVMPVMVVVCAALLPRPISHSPLLEAAVPEIDIPNLVDGQTVGVPRVGHVIADTGHLFRLAAVVNRLDSLLAPDETFLDLTGHGADYFYAGRRMPVTIAAPYNMAHVAQQRRTIQALEANPPPVVLLLAANLNFEGQSTALRAHNVYRWVVQNYRTVEFDDFVYGVMPTDPAVEDESTIQTADHTGENWTNGVSVLNDVFFLDNERLAGLLAPGDVLTFAGSGDRTIVGIDGVNVSLDAMIDPLRDGYPNTIDVPKRLRSAVAAEQELALLDLAFRVSDVGNLAVSWGRSIASLAEQMTSILDVDLSTQVLNDLEWNEDGWLVPTGLDPYLIVELPGIAGADGGLLVTEFECRDGGRAPLQLFWTSELNPTFVEEASVSFNAENGWLIAPLDAQPRWLLASAITQLRLDLNDPAACPAFRVNQPYLAQRNGL